MAREGDKMPDSEAKKKWSRENMLLIGLKLHRQKDADIIDYLTKQGPEKQRAIKRAIRLLITSENWYT